MDKICQISFFIYEHIKFEFVNEFQEYFIYFLDFKFIYKLFDFDKINFILYYLILFVNFGKQASNYRIIHTWYIYPTCTYKHIFIQMITLIRILTAPIIWMTRILLFFFFKRNVICIFRVCKFQILPLKNLGKYEIHKKKILFFK